MTTFTTETKYLIHAFNPGFKAWTLVSILNTEQEVENRLRLRKYSPIDLKELKVTKQVTDIKIITDKPIILTGASKLCSWWKIKLMYLRR
jgi:hypothetical protein